jgi:hypothetical protein
MLATLKNKLRWSYRKNAPDIFALCTRNYPRFVQDKDPEELRDEIPVFTFHTVEPVAFEEKLKFLHQNGYRALNGTEFRAAISGEMPMPPRSVLLTFDDGRASLCSVAFPLLQKYGMQAVAFIIPGLIPDTAAGSRTYADFVAGRASAEELLARESSDEPLCSWEEIQAMHGSGVIDFQSHTMYHHQVCVADELVDFLHPGYPAYFFGNINVPACRDNGEWRYERRLAWGMPVYRAEPRMAGHPAFLDDERVRQACTAFVRREGGKSFFKNADWRKRLLSVYHAQRDKFNKTGMEAPADQHQAILEDLVFSKRMIEEKLPGKCVDHFCYPWFMGCPLVVRLSKEAGYMVNYWGIVPSRPTNRRKQSLFYVPRVEDHYLFRLPGEGRRRLRDILQAKFKNNLPGLATQIMKN